MAFKEKTKDTLSFKNMDEFLSYLLEDEYLSESSTWDEHFKAVKAAQEHNEEESKQEESAQSCTNDTDDVEKNELTLKRKAIKVVDNILNDLLDGNTNIEDAQELLALLIVVETCAKWDV